jgi:UDP-glucose:glycoprotein glucosyltransferase
VPVTSFQSDFVRLSVKRRPGQENVRLDADGEQDEDAEGVWNSVSKMFSTTQTAPVSANETIHVFSIASGHLYERFLKIMMLSVIKSTQNPVKFWFVANFLSPQFKQFAPKMVKFHLHVQLIADAIIDFAIFLVFWGLQAQEYNFQVEFVTYRWPNWLRRQKEKQRVIWGYKILFLDVLFPLRVSKIIFIDADQIVRGNLKELVDMDLQGAPYAYTPFCDSNKAVDGFRFWNQGFWKGITHCLNET